MWTDHPLETGGSHEIRRLSDFGEKAQANAIPALIGNVYLELTPGDAMASRSGGQRPSSKMWRIPEVTSSMSTPVASDS